jgi:hypothetical protein
VTTDQIDASTSEIARLMDSANNKNEAIRKFEASVSEIRQAQAAKAVLRAFVPSELGEVSLVNDLPVAPRARASVSNHVALVQLDGVDTVPMDACNGGSSGVKAHK